MILKVTVFLLLGGCAGGLQVDYHASRLENLGTLYIHNEVPVPNSDGSYNSTCTKDGCVGRVWIYYSDAKRTPQWGTIDRNGMGNYAEQIVCRQLGYTHSNETIAGDTLHNNTIPVWLKNITCGEQPQITDKIPDYARYKNNILQCEAEVCDNCYEHTTSEEVKDLVLSCDGQLYNSDTDYYDGQVYLVAPTLKPYGMQTTMGIIKIFLYKETRGISLITASDVATHFTISKRDSLCKQMGFTGAATDSVFTKTALINQYTFEEHKDYSSWFSVNELNEYCNGATTGPTQCFGCCFEYPPDDTGCNNRVCLEENTLVISCLYEKVNLYIEFEEKGNENKCKFQNNKKLSDKKTVCSNNCPGSSGFVYGIAVSVGPLAIVSVVCGILAGRLVYQKYKRKRNEYEEVKGDNVNEMNQQN